MELDELAVLPAGDKLEGLGGDVAGVGEEVGAAEMLGGAWRKLGLVETSRNGEALRGEGIIVPADAAGDREGRRGEGIGFEPVPTEGADAAREIVGEEMVAVGVLGPELVVAAEEESGAGEFEAREALFEIVAVGHGGVTGEEHGIAARLIHAVDQVDG